VALFQHREKPASHFHSSALALKLTNRKKLNFLSLKTVYGKGTRQLSKTLQQNLQELYSRRNSLRLSESVVQTRNNCKSTDLNRIKVRQQEVSEGHSYTLGSKRSGGFPADKTAETTCIFVSILTHRGLRYSRC